MSAPTSDPSKKAPRSRTKDSVLGQSLRKIDPGQLVFRRFHLERELGEGAMGVVWLARDERDNDQRVALKFLSDFITGHEAALTGLQREVRRARTLSHPGIVTVYDYHANHAEHLSAISMEWIDGPSVADIHGEQPDRCFEPEELVSWLHQLCNALTYLHGKAGIVHGRIKPGNIMIGEHGHLKLADTGFGDDLEDNHDERPSCALPYMSPQQVKKEPAHPSDDIYAIGATFYELLAGTPPFHRGPPKSILFQIENDEPQSINERRQQQRIVGRPPIPPEWETLLADCLAKDAKDRPANAAAVIARLIPHDLPPADEEHAPDSSSSHSRSARVRQPDPFETPASHAAPVVAASGSPAARRPAKLWLAGIAALIALIAVIAVASRKPQAASMETGKTSSEPGEAVVSPAPDAPIKDATPEEPVAANEPAVPPPDEPVVASQPEPAPVLTQEQQLAASRKQADESYLKKDYATAFKLYSEAAGRNDPWAIFQLGKMHSEGSGIERDKKKAMELYQSAAAKGHARALNYLGQIYEEGDGVRPDPKKAKELYQQALFLVLHDAAKGTASAQYDLGSMYASGRGVARNEKQAVELFEKAAMQGDIDAQVDLALMYAAGRGVTKDPAKAMRLFEKAAAQGNDMATFNLGSIYETAQGVPQDERKAAALYSQAAESGNRLAMRALARFHDEGRGGLPKDPAKAQSLRLKAK